MKKLIIALIALLFIVVPFNIKALNTTNTPYKTYTIGPKNKLIETQTAYEPAGKITYNLNSPEDMYIKDDIIYIADTGNKRILKYNIETNQFELFKDGFLQPTGVHVDENNNVYVADKEAKAIYIYDELGNHHKTLQRPLEPIFGQALFVPMKIVTGPRGVIYVVGDGSVGGLIQLNQNGEFQGFFGANETKTSFIQKMAKFFNVRTSKNIPVSPLNVAIDDKGSIYTVSVMESNKLKKFNIASQPILKITEEENYNSIFINDFNNIYTITNEGIIYEYDSFGNLIFKFGGKDKGTRRLGLFVTPVDIVVDSENNIYVLDKALNEIQILQKSEFTALIHEGLKSFKEGIYNIEEWEEVLRMNAMFSLANSAIARAEFRNQHYSESLNYYKIASDRTGYSESFWQIRYNFLQTNMVLILVILLGVIMAFRVLRFADGKWNIYTPIREKTNKLKEVKLISELKLLFKMFKHPVDTFYELKKNKKGSYLAATIIYITFIIIMILNDYLRAFIFNFNDLETYNLLRTFLIWSFIILLFVLGNYLISSLQGGEGFFKDIYVCGAYILAPIIVFMPFLILLTHGLTYNEEFIFSALNFLTISWSFLLLIIMIKEIHNYSISELIINILLTIFAAIMIVVVMMLLYLLTNQLYEYVTSILKEVFVYAKV